jgi:hypothetical protein
VNEYFSEKWFYNHFKTYNEKLPRIDLLNVLSRYTGYTDWSEFKFKNKDKITLITEHKGSNRIFYLLPAAALLVFIIAWIIIRTGSMTSYKFCFIDKDTKEPIKDSAMEVDVLFKDESPLRQQCDTDGCFILKTAESKVRFVVKAPYYLTDTITRVLNKARKTEEIPLKINDYALMIFYFSNSMVSDWKNRRDRLDQVIADSAYICQVFNKSMTGIELYNKTEFIDMITIPTRSLKNIQIIEMLYTGEKITTIRFTQNYQSN